MISNFLNYLSLYKRKFKYKKISYSFNAVDLIIDYMFKEKKWYLFRCRCSTSYI